MRQTVAIAADLLREAVARRWVLALTGAVTLALLVVLFGLRLEVVDGALAATRLFGSFDTHGAIQAVDVALRPLFQGVAWLVFYGGLASGVIVCADFAPKLLEPGRIEHLLALPVRRGELLAGTFLGVVALVLAGGAYGAGGMTLILWAKTGVVNAGPLLAAALACAGFATIYAVMLLAAVVVRSAALSAAAGAVTLVLGVAASHRASLAAFFSPGAARTLLLGGLAALPRLDTLASAAWRVSASQPVGAPRLLAVLAGCAAFALAILALAVWRFDSKDY